MALIYRISCAPAVDKDVATRHLTVMVAGEPKGESVYNAGDTDLGEVSAEQGQSVVLTLVDRDDAGNSSEPAVIEFVAADTIPPQKPDFSVALVREE